MLQLKMIVLGETGSGKTALIQRFREDTFETASYNEPIYYLPALIKNIKLKIWDISGSVHALMGGKLVEEYLEDTELCLYTIDLSKPLNREQFREDFEKIKAKAAKAAFILIGTKADLPRKISNEDLQSLLLTYGLPSFFITSALNGNGFKELFSTVANTANLQKIEDYVIHSQQDSANCSELSLRDIKILLPADSLLYQPILDLEAELLSLPTGYKLQVEKAVVDLVTGLTDPQKDKLKVIEQFNKNTNQILEVAYQNGVSKTQTAKITQKVAIVVVVSVLIVSIASFAIGVGPISLTLSTAVGLYLGYRLACGRFFNSSNKLPEAIFEVQKTAASTLPILSIFKSDVRPYFNNESPDATLLDQSQTQIPVASL